MDATAPSLPFARKRVGPEDQGHPPPPRLPETHRSQGTARSTSTPSSEVITCTGPVHPSWSASDRHHAVNAQRQLWLVLRWRRVVRVAICSIPEGTSSPKGTDVLRRPFREERALPSQPPPRHRGRTTIVQHWRLRSHRRPQHILYEETFDRRQRQHWLTHIRRQVRTTVQRRNQQSPPQAGAASATPGPANTLKATYPPAW